MIAVTDKKCLFIGGIKDGEVEVLREMVRYIQIPKLSPQPIRSTRYLQESVEYEIESYTWYDFLGNCLPAGLDGVYVINEQDAMRHLLSLYAGTKKSADDGERFLAPHEVNLDRLVEAASIVQSHYENGYMFRFQDAEFAVHRMRDVFVGKG